MWGWIVHAAKFVLNPANWVKIVSVVEAILTLISEVRKRWAKRKQEKENEEIKTDEAIVSDASKTDEERAEALCRIEKKLNPDSKCDDPVRDDELPKGSSGT